MRNDEKAKQVVDKMMRDDLFSQWLGIEVLEVKEGYSKIKMMVRKEMINGFGIVHGGIAFSLGDSCFVFACNNRNNLSVALDTAINFTKPGQSGSSSDWENPAPIKKIRLDLLIAFCIAL